ncbi:hypothetical protein B0H17DRAFT_1092153 [Mycena rosella]|uniref:Uncharacterized protein n=1 Tax=Mycena rosella TaxID=1033263 RepID=A0AAD7CVE6_MYCRO|nr:hypothetical protein B0H17DRAFT_1092153 [Mycena rosella]
MNFSGTAVYIFVAYPSGKQATVPLGFVARIDDFPSGEWTADELAPLNNFLAFSNNTLANKPHTLLLQLNPGASLYFDYAIVTSDADPNSASTSSSGSSTSSSGSPPPEDTLKSKKKPPVGAIVGGVVGGLLLIALVATPLLLRRRAMAKKRAIQSGGPFIVEPRISIGRDKQADKDEGVPAATITPFVLQSPPPARSEASSKKSALSVRIPSTQPPVGAEIHSPHTATSPVLTQMAEEMRRITMSVQRLESGMPEAQDGGPILQRPPAYGNRSE